MAQRWQNTEMWKKIFLVIISLGVFRIFSADKEQSYTQKNQDATILSVTYAENFPLEIHAFVAMVTESFLEHF